MFVESGIKKRSGSVGVEPVDGRKKKSGSVKVMRLVSLSELDLFAYGLSIFDSYGAGSFLMPDTTNIRLLAEEDVGSMNHAPHRTDTNAPVRRSTINNSSYSSH